MCDLVVVRITMRMKEFLDGILSLRNAGNSANFAHNSRTCRRILVKVFRRSGCPTRNKPFASGADKDHVRTPDSGILVEFLTQRDKVK